MWRHENGKDLNRPHNDTIMESLASITAIIPTLARRLLFLVLLAFVLPGLVGCTSIDGPLDERDPWEAYNRAMFSFNDAVDRNVVKPVAQGYHDYIPDPVRSGVSNVFSNLDDVLVTTNDLLQFKFERAVHDFSRLIYNTILGVFGIFDVASELGLPKHNEDFGQTLAVWGWQDSTYLIVPLLPPSTVRDTTGLVADWQLDPVTNIDRESERYTAIILETIDRRAQLLSASRVLDEAALDRYAFVRDAYFQLRRNQIYDGNPPREETDLPPANGDADLDLELELELERELEGGAPPAPK